MEDTYSATQTITVKENPISNDTEFLNYLYKGLFDRSPEGFEISRFFTWVKGWHYDPCTSSGRAPLHLRT